MNPSSVITESPLRLRPLILFTALYMIAAIVAAILTGNREFVFYIVVMLVLIGAIAVVHWRLRLTNGQLWALSVWGLLHMAGGLVPVPDSWPVSGPIRVLYSLWIIPGALKYDQIVHAYGFGVTTWLCWHAIRTSLRDHRGNPPAPTFGMLTLAAAGGMGFGALNEVVEFIATLTIPQTNVGGYVNTGWDLVSNLAGCCLASAAIWVWAGKSVK